MSRETFMMVERRMFEHGILYALVQAGALSQQQAAAVCTEIAQRLPAMAEGDPEASAILPKFVEKWENSAAAMLA